MEEGDIPGDPGELMAQLARAQIVCTFQTFRGFAQRGFLTVDQAAAEICEVAAQLEREDWPVGRRIATELRILAAGMEAASTAPAKH